MHVKLYKSLKVKIIGVIMATLCLTVGATYWYIINKQSRQFVETVKEQAQMLTHALVKSIQHDMKGTCQKDIQGIFERIGLLPDIESLRIFDETGRVTKSADPKEISLTIEDIGYEIFKANIPSKPYRGGHGQNAFCMVETIRNEESCKKCHYDSGPVIGIFELCLSMAKTDKKIADNRRFLLASAVITILSVAVLLSAFITFQVNRPVEKLIKAMRQTESGDLSVRAKIQWNDEVGMLASSLNAMIQRLEEINREVEHLHTDQLIRADRLAAIGELAAGVAHEIKNPLAGISGAVQVLADDFDVKDPRRIITEQIIKQTERVDKTIRDLLSFAQPIRAELSLIDANAVLEQSLFICLPNAAAAGITIVKHFAGDLPLVVFDMKHLQQVFINLILNAVQAMPNGGSISLTTSVTGERGGEGGLNATAFIRVTIADTGPGISAETAAKIFTPFFTTKTQGTGLGLSITKRILENHGASISYETAPGRGTTFVIELPVGRPAEVVTT